MALGYLLVVFLFCLGDTFASCPHEEEGLAKFSETFTGLTKESEIEVKTSVLLDVEEVNVTSITITGRLVFNRGHPITVNVKVIKVLGDGELTIGGPSDECRHTDEVDIILEGVRPANRDPSDNEGEKVIIVRDNAKLNIHGPEKLAWTKLTATVDRYDADSSNVLFRLSDSSDYETSGDGLILKVFQLNDDFYMKYDTYKNSLKSEQKQVDALNTKLGELVDGDVWSLSISYRFKHYADFEQLFTTIEDVADMATNSLKLRNAQTWDAFTMVCVKGGACDQSLDISAGKRDAYAEASLDLAVGYKITSFSKVRENGRTNSDNDIRILKSTVGYPVVTVSDDINSWAVGDEILLTTTDYSPYHGEVRRIKEKLGDNTFRLDGELSYRHFGEMQHGVDTRGEAALVSRNIRITGQMERDCPAGNGNCGDLKYDTYGGNVKIFGFSHVIVQGAQLSNMGQTMEKGFYPLHFHMCKNITGKTAILRQNVIRDCYKRAITVHGTYGTDVANPGVQLLDNVAYNILGMTYFLEDGNEVATILRGNLAAETRNVNNGFKVDANKASGFWITNPKVIMIGNVGAGSEGFCMWYSFPDLPVGPSANTDVYTEREAAHTAIWTNYNNVVHSCLRGGFTFDNVLISEDGDIAGCMNYLPVVNPLDTTSAAAKAQIVRLTAYKNLNINLWLRGGYFEVMQYSSADSQRGMQLARASKQPQFITKSIFIGETDNVETPDYPGYMSPSHYHGYVVHDGPTYISDSFFDKFVTGHANISYASAIGLAPRNKLFSSITSTLTRIRFGFIDSTEGIRVLNSQADSDEVLGFGTFTGDEASTFRDGDGSLTSCSGSSETVTQLVAPETHLVIDSCELREAWDMMICGGKYGKVAVVDKEHYKGTSQPFEMKSQMRRREFADPTAVVVEDLTNSRKHSHTVYLNDDTYYYEYQFTSEKIPKRIKFQGLGVERDHPIVMGVCLPEGTLTSELEIWRSHQSMGVGTDGIKYVETLDQVVQDVTKTYMFYDVPNRMLYFKISSRKTRNPYWDRFDVDNCPGGDCPTTVIRLTKQRDYSPCYTVADSELSTTVDSDSIPLHTCELPTGIPDQSWGAGDSTVTSRDGNWGTWSSWQDCCNADSVVRTTRYRVCDNPPNLNGGADCPGISEETKDCEQECPTDGTLSEWSAWSDCDCNVEGTRGVRTRSRTCDDTTNGGTACDGDIEDMGVCPRGVCGDFEGEKVNGVPTEWSDYTDCFCDGIAVGSLGVKTKTRSCVNPANGGKCDMTTKRMASCRGDCGYD